ncbi:hypothetical protein HK096_011022 [Nowakowskiella sp. JEL0078]|nr:hypothetical protein HK096_011022 [Nowakowskiella sp. JEL0078]
MLAKFSKSVRIRSYFPLRESYVSIAPASLRHFNISSQLKARKSWFGAKAESNDSVIIEAEETENGEEIESDTIESSKIGTNWLGQELTKLRPAKLSTQEYKDFLVRLKEDGGDKWHRKPITRHFRQALVCAILKAKESGMDLNKTYIADVYAFREAIASKVFIKAYVRGRGRYGSTPHPITSMLSFILQEREEPFKKRVNDPLEWIRDRLRQRQTEFEKSADEIYIEKRQKRPIKVIYRIKEDDSKVEKKQFVNVK